MLKISVIIPAINKPMNLQKCVCSILKNTYKNFEIIIVDQGEVNVVNGKELLFDNPKIQYFKVNWKGKTRALNFGIKKSKGDIVAFTDHDCIVTTDWLQNIIDFFNNNKDVYFITGRVLPFKISSNKNVKVVIPDYKLVNFTKKTRSFTKPLYAMTVVTGNNMAVKKSLFSKIGLYKTWLGPGAKGFAGEDTEIAIRSILAGYKMCYVPNIKVYHDGYTKISDFEKKEFLYFCGYVSVFVYYLILGNIIFGKFLWRIIVAKMRVWKKYISKSFIGFHPGVILRVFFMILYESVFIARATFVPFIH